MVRFMVENQIPITAEQIRKIVEFYDAESPEMLDTIVDDLEPSRLNFQPMPIGRS